MSKDCWIPGFNVYVKKKKAKCFSFYKCWEIKEGLEGWPSLYYRKVEWIGFSLQQARRNIWGRWGQILSQSTLLLAEKYTPFFGEDTSCAKIVHCNRFAPVFLIYFGSYWSQPFIRLFRLACGWPAILVVAPSSLWRQRTRRSRVKEKESNSRRRTVGSLSKIVFFWSQKIWIWRTQKNHGL